MREETRRKLDKMENEDRRLVVSAVVGALVMAAAAGGLFALHNSRETTATVEGIVRRAVWRHDKDSGRRYADMQVMLDDGRLVDVGTPLTALPDVGAHAVLEQRTSGLGLVSYRLKL